MVKESRLEREVRSTMPLFEKCYQFECAGTPEEQRNACSSHNDQIILAALRLGGPTGIPGGYILLLLCKRFMTAQQRTLLQNLRYHRMKKDI